MLSTAIFLTLLVVANAQSNGLCEENEFRCPSHLQCYPLDWVCDGYKDCSDGSDEQDCTYTPCEEDGFQCPSGSPCFSLNWVCDGYRQCSDGYDEQNCTYAPCVEDEFRCPSGSPCYPLDYMCDGEKDCSDGYDEQNCTYAPCDEDRFRCPSGSLCYPLDYMCDGDRDCSDGYDEQNCTYAPCEVDQFQCPTGSPCFPLLILCDNITDCSDEFDEQNCSTVYLSLSDDIISDHGYVAISDIGSTNDAALICHTKHPPTSHSRGDWFTPGGRVVNSDSVPGFRRHESPIAMRLFKNNATDPEQEGIYQCVVKFDVLAEQTVHMGLYHSGGSISMPNTPTLTVNSDLNGANPEFTLTCISTGGPATTVTWTRDSETVTKGTETVLDDPVTAQYTHTLTVTGRLGGIYTCTVANDKPSENFTDFHIHFASAPTNVMAVQEGLTSIRVSWSPPTPLGDTTGYRIYYSGYNSGYVNVSGGSTDNYLLTGLQNGSIYTISLVATSFHLSSAAIDQEVILYPSMTTCSQTDYTAAITGGVVVVVVFVISVTVVIVVLLLRGKQRSHSLSEMNSAVTKSAEAHERYELSAAVDTDAIHTSTNEAYHVVSRSGGVDINYAEVTTLPSLPHSTPHPSKQTTAENSIYEPV